MGAVCDQYIMYGIKIVFDNLFLGLAGSPKEKKVLVAEQVKY